MFSPLTRHYFETARGFGQLASPTHQSCLGGERDGHYFQLQLQLDAYGLVQELAYRCPRCVPAIACGAYLYERLVGNSAAQEITVKQVIDALRLPPARSFHAWMAVQAFQQAVHPGETR